MAGRNSKRLEVRGPWQPPKAVASSWSDVKVKDGGSHTEYTGSADAIVAAGFARREEVPGVPGCPRKTMMRLERGERDLRLERRGQLGHLLVFLSHAEREAKATANLPKDRRRCSAPNQSGQ